jgi:cytoskeletal protein CcmA (bactofilin family)
MFGRKKTATVDVSRLASLLGRDTSVHGDVTFGGGLRIDGRVDGNVVNRPDSPGLLVLSETGVVVGGVKVHDAVINGRVEGDLEVTHFLELQANARVTGNISYRTLKLECGATVDGKLERLGGNAEAADSPTEGQDADEPRVVSFARGG